MAVTDVNSVLSNKMPVALQDLLEQVNVLNNSLIQQVDLSGFHYSHDEDEDALESYIPHRNPPPPVPSLSLRTPSASAFISKLESAGTPLSYAKELASILVERSTELAERYTAIYTKTCEELQVLWRPSSLGSLSSLYNRIGRLQETYNLKVESWVDEMISTARERFDTSTPGPFVGSRPTSSKSSFNNVRQFNATRTSFRH